MDERLDARAGGVPPAYSYQDLPRKQERVGHNRAVRVSALQPVQRAEGAVRPSRRRLTDRHVEERGVGDPRLVGGILRQDALELLEGVLDRGPIEQSFSQTQAKVQVGRFPVGTSAQVAEGV